MTQPDRLLHALDDAEAAGPLVREIEAMLKIESPTALARAAGLLVWKRAYEAEHGRSHGGDRRSRTRDQSEKFSFCSVAAVRLGLTERAIQLDVQLAEQLGAPDIRRLWTSKIADNAAALRTVAGLPPETRTSLFGVMAAQPDASFSVHLVAAGLKAERDADDWQFQRLHDMWSAANSRVRRRFLQQIGAQLVRKEGGRA